jgi:hypothetical protein
MDKEQKSDLIELSERELDFVTGGENNGNQNSPGGIAILNGTDVKVVVFV